ncbi:MAG: TIGR00725 family protein [Planctomycetes bacterium]|nr:TIGR00725 family protein [Planctomycetota bacterium]MCB9829233.1 TIGR00725 family protein [Planctomycetota bacterium]
MKRQIAVFGPGHPTRREYNLAAEVGRLLAENGVTVVCGGLYGVMEAVCMGAKEAGGTTIGILRTYNARHANPYVDHVIPSGLGDARNVLVATAGEAAIAIGGRLGTLSEIAIALKHGLPVVGLQTWSLDRGALFDRFVPEARTAEEAVTMALTLAEEQRQRVDAGVEEDDESETPHSGPVRPPPTDEEA